MQTIEHETSIDMLKSYVWSYQKLIGLGVTFCCCLVLLVEGVLCGFTYLKDTFKVYQIFKLPYRKKIVDFEPKCHLQCSLGH